ncbi:CWF19-like protein 2 [Scylla paramamosain]|uniref:CWF19-like protein 2 n=1 Tax=Scylla paramamosain TaxID=85552 RepID=UPI0030828BE9
MSASLINFESAREKEQKRQWERKARQNILEKAQQEFETRQQKEEAARQRGEHTWMLPSVEARLSQDHDSAKKKKKKKDKKKKKKKEKKAKKNKRKDSSSSSSDSEDDESMGEGVWVARTASTSSSAPAKAPSPQSAIKGPQLPPQESTSEEPLKRDGWMEMTSLFGTFSRDEMREREGTSRKKAKEEEEKKKREAAKPGSHARELNPYYKDGGTGLPQEQQKATPVPAAATSQITGLDAGWLRKALQRAKEQASAEGKSLEEIAAQRWGSLARFNELLAEAEGRGKQRQNDSRSQDRRRERRSRSRERDRMRNRSRERDRRKSKSRDRDGNKNRSKSQERERNAGIRKERRNRSRSREKRDRSEERRRHCHRRSSSSSSSGNSSSRSSSSSDSSRSSSRNRSKQGSKKDDYHCREDSSRFSHKFLRPSEEPSKSSALSQRFQKPVDDNFSRHASQSACRASSNSSSSSSSRWQKKEYKQPVKQQEPQRRAPSPSSSSSSSSSEDEPISEPPKPATVGPRENPAATKPPAAASTQLTDKEMNELAAKIMKAELVGNDTQAAKLKARLEAAREARAAGGGPGQAGAGEGSGQKEEVVVLTRTDSRGVSRPVMGAGAEDGHGKRRTKVKTHGQDGQRARYFPDDDHYNLKNMFEKEKGTTAEDQNAMFEQAAMKNIERLNDDYDIDDMFMSKAALRDSAAKQAERDKKKAIQEHQRVERSLENCHWCFDNKEMPKHLIVALGKKCYVSLPTHQSLTPGHCCISPIHHISCCVQAEEDLWDEVQNFRKSLVKMFASRGEDCIFFETVKRLRHFPHMVLQCVPLPRETGDMAPIYFKKAIMECEREWAQNKKLVELKGRDVRRAVPKGLPYFFVDFAMDAGFAHVIEDEQEFPNNFAQEIVGGMLDLDCNLWRKPRQENFDNQRRKVMEFSRWYKEFDISQEG